MIFNAVFSVTSTIYISLSVALVWHSIWRKCLERNRRGLLKTTFVVTLSQRADRFNHMFEFRFKLRKLQIQDTRVTREVTR